jgi:MFS family permease
MSAREGHKGLLLLFICGVLFLDGLDLSLVGVALPSIKFHLGLTTSQAQWVISAYVLGYGGFLLLGGRTADLCGRRKTLLLALAVFAGASVLSGVTASGALLVVMRFLKGASAAFTAPAGLSIITTQFEQGRERDRALSYYAATGASGFSLGLVFGGLLTQVGWRWALIVPGPIAVGLLAVALLVVPRDAVVPGAVRRLDVPGAISLTAAMLLLVWTTVEAPSRGWLALPTVIGYLVCAALLVSFVAIERGNNVALIRLGILRTRPLVLAMVAAGTLFGAYIGLQFVLTLYLQSVNNWSPVKTALAFLPLGAVIAAESLTVGRVMQRVGTQRLIAAGFVAMTIGYFIIRTIGVRPDYAPLILPTMILVGAGIGSVFPASLAQATNGVDPTEQGLASGLVQCAQQIGGALGLAIVTATVTAEVGKSTHDAVVVQAFRAGLTTVTGICAAGLLVSIAGLRGSRAAPASSSAIALEPAD